MFALTANVDGQCNYSPCHVLMQVSVEVLETKTV